MYPITVAGASHPSRSARTQSTRCGEGRIQPPGRADEGNSLTLFFNPHQMLYLVDHAAHRGRVLEHAATVSLVQPEALQSRSLIRLAADRAARLHDGHRFLAIHYTASRGSASRRPSISPTFLPRRPATARGLVARLNATKVALIMLCGLGLPIDFATTSWIPSASKIARIGPPAIIPVPALAARTTTWPAP